MSESLSRRSFVAISLALPAGLAGAAGTLAAEELRQLTAADPRAPALGYVADAAQAKADKMFKPGSSCSNCAQLKGKPGDKLRPCALFPDLQNPKQMLLVSAGGWCRSWMALPKPA